MLEVGVTADGKSVVIGGNEVTIDDMRLTGVEQSILRDGGTRIFESDQGRLTLPKRVGSADRTPVWEPKRPANHDLLGHSCDGLDSDVTVEIRAMSHTELVDFGIKMQDAYDRLLRRVEDLIDEPDAPLYWQRLKREALYG